MGKTRSDWCVYILISAIFVGAISQFVAPALLPGIDALWVSIIAAIIGMGMGTMLIFFQDKSHQKKYRGQV